MYVVPINLESKRLEYNFEGILITLVMLYMHYNLFLVWMLIFKLQDKNDYEDGIFIALSSTCVWTTASFRRENMTAVVIHRPKGSPRMS